MIFRVLIITICTNFLAFADAPYKEANDVICPTKEDCTITNQCKCWCSHKCGPRNKVKDDNPIFLMSDPYGNYCYCNQWDIDNYDRCKAKEGNQQSAELPSNIISNKR